LFLLDLMMPKVHGFTVCQEFRKDASDAVKSAVEARARRLALYHHDPMHDDNEPDRIVAGCRTQIQEYGANLACFAAADGQRLYL
jgi:DNA-binding response OmpR family regulator